MRLLFRAIPVVLALGVASCALVVLRQRRRWRVAMAVAFAILGTLVVGSQWSAAFDGYDSDLWTYLVIVERVAVGQSVLDREPFLLEPPASPQVSALWIALGFVRRWTGLTPVTLAHGLGFVSGLLLCWSAYRLGRVLFRSSSPSMVLVSVLLFWFALPETWAALALGRTLCLGFVLLAAAEVLDDAAGRPRPLLLGLWVALGFHVHLFGGVLAGSAAALALAARWAHGNRPGFRRFGAGALLAAILSAPSLAHTVTTAGLTRSSAHLWRPGQLTMWGLSFLEPGELLAQISAPLLLMTIMGLAVRVPGTDAARTFGRIGMIAVALVFFTPLYGLAAKLFGAWLVPRFAVLATPWVGATLTLAYLLHGEERGRLWRNVTVALALGLLTLVLVHPIARACAEIRGKSRDFRFSAEAQREAQSLRDRLKDRVFLSVDLISYALASPTLGRPLAVPAGHASPFGDFVRQQRRVHRALLTNTPECWAALFSLYPEVNILVTPAPGATDERRVWNTLVATSPDAVREVLEGMGALEPAFAGRFFVMDALHPQPSSGVVAGMGKGSQCRHLGGEP